MVSIKVEKYLEVGGTNKLFSFAYTLEAGSALGITGPSGCGKTSLLKMISGLMSPKSAEVSIGQVKLTDTLEGIEVPLDKREIAMVFQDQALFPNMTIAQHIQFINKGVQESEIERMLHRLQLDEQLHTFPDKLSGGQKQRLAILLAIVSCPKLLLLDEPFTALDDLMRAEVIALLKDYAEGRNLPIILVSHQIQILDQFCEQLIKLPALQV